MREGNYDELIPASGPPEIRKSCEEANELARTLGELSHDNRNLLRKVVSLQDDERRDPGTDGLYRTRQLNVQTQTQFWGW